jgi:hypothetical protein
MHIIAGVREAVTDSRASTAHCPAAVGINSPAASAASAGQTGSVPAGFLLCSGSEEAGERCRGGNHGTARQQGLVFIHSKARGENGHICAPGLLVRASCCRSIPPNARPAGFLRKCSTFLLPRPVLLGPAFSLSLAHCNF